MITPLWLQAHETEILATRWNRLDLRTHPSGSQGYALPFFSKTLNKRLTIARHVTYISKLILHPSKVLEVQIKKENINPKAGQYIFISCPEISYLQYHPFTLTSAPEEDYVSVHMRIVGDWTSVRLFPLPSSFTPFSSFFSFFSSSSFSSFFSFSSCPSFLPFTRIGKEADSRRSQKLSEPISMEKRNKERKV
jgi:hypothetical protein